MTKVTDFGAGTSLLQFHTEAQGSIPGPAEAELGQLMWGGGGITTPEALRSDNAAWRRPLVLRIVRSIWATEGPSVSGVSLCRARH